LGYRHNFSQQQVQSDCSNMANCAGAALHPGGDWWLLSNTKSINGVGKSPAGNTCLVRPGQQALT
jgi:hypothetical protein